MISLGISDLMGSGAARGIRYITSSLIHLPHRLAGFWITMILQYIFSFATLKVLNINRIRWLLWGIGQGPNTCPSQRLYRITKAIRTHISWRNTSAAAINTLKWYATGWWHRDTDWEFNKEFYRGVLCRFGQNTGVRMIGRNAATNNMVENDLEFADSIDIVIGGLIRAFL